MISSMVFPSIVAEIEYNCFQKDENECNNCRDRFKCWTNRQLNLSVKQFSLETDVSYDKFKFTADLPSCFMCRDMIGHKVTIYAVDNVGMMFKGIITAHYTKAGETAPMEIQIEGKKWIF